MHCLKMNTSEKHNWQNQSDIMKTMFKEMWKKLKTDSTINALDNVLVIV